MTQEIGSGKLKLLILVNDENINSWVDFIKNAIASIELKNLMFTVTSNLKIDDLKSIIKDNENSQFIFVLDLSKDGTEICGYGDRYQGIFNKSNFDQSVQIDESTDAFAKWYSDNYEFSLISMGNENNKTQDLAKNIFVYLNGRL